MPELTVISDKLAGSVLAACTAREEKSGDAGLDELVGDDLPVAVAHQDLPLEAAGLSADSIETTDLESVIRDPTGFWVKRSGTLPGPIQVTLERAPGRVTLSVALPDARIAVPTPDVLPRQGWLIVKRGAQSAVRHQVTIPNNGSDITLSGVVAAGDLLIAFVVGHRPAFQIAS